MPKHEWSHIVNEYTLTNINTCKQEQKCMLKHNNTQQKDTD